MTEQGYWRMRRRCETLTPGDFEFVPSPRPASAAPGELLVRARYISLDPYLARAMKSWSGEIAGWADGTVHGRIVGEVIESRSEDFAPGDAVLTIGRWQELQNVPASTAMLIPTRTKPSSLALGVLGRSGLTAWVGLRLAALTPADTVLVSAATGPVGGTAGQLARRQGCRVLGIAGGAAKCRHAVEALNFEACFDHRLPDLAGRIADAVPEGISVLFENVGATSLDATLPSMRHGGRIVLAGLAQHYNDEDPFTLQNFKALLHKALSLKAFVTAEYSDLFPEAMMELQTSIEEGSVHFDETVIDGIERAPKAYVDMLKGSGIGKRLIRL